MHSNREMKNLNKSAILILNGIVFFAFYFYGCMGSKEQIPDVSSIDIDTRIIRFDSLLYTIESNTDIKVLQSNFPKLFDLYFYRILALPRPAITDSLLYTINKMLDAETFKELKHKIPAQYGNFSDFSEQWNQAMRYYKYYFQPATVPDLYTTVTEFAYGSFIFPISDSKDGVGLSLDLFLGDSVNYAAMVKLDPSFSSYNSRTFNQDHLIKKAVDALLDDMLPQSRNPQFLDALIREGKKYYFSDNILPFLSDTVIWEYTPDQLQWVQDNERNIYSFLVSNDLIYSTQRSKFMRLLSAAPNSPDMPPDAPGRAAIFIGYKIIDAFMQRYPDTSFDELVKKDASELFQEAKYKPRLE